MVFRKIMYFQWTPSQVHQIIYTAGVVDILCQVIHLMKKVICLSVLAWFFYPEKDYQCHLIVLVDKTNMFSMKTIEWS